MLKVVVFSSLFLMELLDLQRRASKRLREASSPVKAAASVSLGTSPPARRQSSRQAAQMPRGAQRGSKSKFVTGGSARRSMSGSDGMRTTYNYWLTPHVAEPQATAKLILLGPPSDCWYYKGTVQGKLGQCSAKPSSFVCHVGSGSLSALHCTAAS